jgi:uncharacterized SAM-binding protein YcdF (DUF218 family)
MALLGIAAGAWFARVPLLQGTAQLWIVSEPVAPADAVAVLGGGLDVRPFAAAEYYGKGLTKKILLADVRRSPSEKLGVLPPHTELNRQVLLKLGVPEQAIETFGSASSNTREEALALRAWAEHTRSRTIIVPTEVFSSRRVRWMLEHVFAGSGVRVQVTALDALEYTRADWWRHEQGLIAFQNEVIKYIYYRFKY